LEGLEEISGRSITNAKSFHRRTSASCSFVKVVVYPSQAIEGSKLTQSVHSFAYALGMPRLICTRQ
jgi:hypothetical protein